MTTHATVTLNDFVVASSEVVYRSVGDEAVILDVTAGLYFGLEAVGRTVWEYIQQSRKVIDVLQHVQQGFDVERSKCAQDVCAFLAELQEKKLVRVSSQADL